MSLYFYLPLICVCVLAAFMTIIWAIARTIRNNSIVDVFWAFNFAIIAAIVYLVADGYEPRKLLVCSLAALWSLRLGIYLAIRVGAHIREEEGRYRQLREEWADNLHLKFFAFFQMQGLSNVFLAIPYFLIALNPEPQISVLEYIGAGMWLLSIIGEGMADLQLQLFRRDPANKGKVCDRGLWNYSRHPNYFFQFMIWVSVCVFALASPYGYIAVVCPLVIAYLIFKVTGIPMTEEQSIRSRGDAYRRYQQTTSAFVPWFKKSPQS
jgi:steroid 5-alpha reductase family enzyme